MSDKKNIDRLFQEKFKDFETSPKDHVWEGIEERLRPKKKKRRVIPIWWRVGGAAAILLLMFAIGNTLFNTEDDIVPTLVDTNNTQPSEEANPTKSDLPIVNDGNNTSIASENNSQPKTNQTNTEQQKASKAIIDKNDTNTNSKSFNNAIANNPSNEIKNSLENTSHKDAIANQSSQENKSSKSTDIIPQSEIENQIKAAKEKNTNALADATNSKEKRVEDAQIDPSKVKDNTSKKGQSIEEAIAEANTITEKEEELNRWSIAPNVAPVYFSSLGTGSAIGPEFNSNNTATDISISYGIEGSYAINKRLKIKAGVNTVSFNRATEDVLAFSGSGAVARGATPIVGNITLNSTTQPITLLSSANLSNASAPQSITALPTGSLEQRFGYIEIPLELEYRAIDNKFGVSLIGGFSTFFLNENDIFTNINGTSTLIGEANNLNGISYSANFGVGLNYSLSKQFNLNLEPKFKYQINTFNNTSGNFQPFFIGVYTGLSFKF